MKTNRNTASSGNARPPDWAETLLRLTLKENDRDPVSGDLLEEYRETIRPARGARAADRWYILQVGGFLCRATWIWTLLFSGAFLARTAYDWFVPTHDFAARSTATTAIAVAIMLMVGFWAAWRSRSFIAGTLAALVTSLTAAIMQVAGAAALLAIWHDPQTMSAIRGSGGLAEVFELPFMMAVPAVFLGTVGGVIGSAITRLQRKTAGT